MGSIIEKFRSARLQADLNRAWVSFGRYILRLDRRQLFRDGKPVVLNGKAFDLLIAFVESDGCVLSREGLYERLWGEHIVEEANLSQTVYLLRRTLDPDGDGRKFIETVPRIGYRFAQPLEAGAPPPRSHRSALASAVMILCLLTLIADGVVPIARSHASIPSVARNDDELGEYHLALRTPDHLTYALDYFERAQRLAPQDAFAYSGAAATYALLAEFQAEGSTHQRALVSLALASTANALRQNRNFPRALAVRGFIAYRFQDDRATAERDLQSALAVDPSDAVAHLWYGVLLMGAGKLADATSEFQAAHRLAPTSEVSSRWLARAYVFEGKPDQAIAEAHETLRIRPDDAPAFLIIADAQEQRGEIESAIDTLQILVRKDPYERPFVVPDLARLELRLGKGVPAFVSDHIGVLALSGRVDPFETALLYLTIGRKAAGRHMLQLTDHSALAIQRHDPRLLALL